MRRIERIRQQCGAGRESARCPVDRRKKAADRQSGVHSIRAPLPPRREPRERFHGIAEAAGVQNSRPPRLEFPGCRRIGPEIIVPPLPRRNYACARRCAPAGRAASSGVSSGPTRPAHRTATTGFAATNVLRVRPIDYIRHAPAALIPGVVRHAVFSARFIRERREWRALFTGRSPGSIGRHEDKSAGRSVSYDGLLNVQRPET